MINVNNIEELPLGKVEVRTDIQSSIGPFNYFPKYLTQYPQVVTSALADLYAEYNNAFDPLVGKNREWVTDYQHAIGPDGIPNNCLVQIDMVGLPDSYLKTASHLKEAQVREDLR